MNKMFMFTELQPQPLQVMRSLYVNLINAKDIVMSDMIKLSTQLQNRIDGKENIMQTKQPLCISRATDQAIAERIQELKGEKVPFQTTQLAHDKRGIEVRQALEGLALQLKNAGVNLISPCYIDIRDFCTLHYDEDGIIKTTSCQPDLIGLNALEVVAGIAAQDFGLVIERENKLIYFYGSARYEKTPKHVETGYDYFLGEDFLEWHRRIPVWGETLAELFKRLYLAFQNDRVDSLVIDLKGRHHYTDGLLTVQRYERDYALPLKTIEGKLNGMIVFADSLFKNINDELSPFFGGKHLLITSPRAFHEAFHIIKHDTFYHHPAGIRNSKGESPLLT
jgi:hypothetical protein